MELQPLGRTGVMIPEIGVGTADFTGGAGTLRRMLEGASTLVDTAERYGTEAVVGEAMRGIRDRVFVATKAVPDNFRRVDLIKAADRSLRLLGTDRIDLYQLHWPSEVVPIEETVSAMEELVDAGKVRFIGVSNFGVRLLKKAQAAARRHPIVSNQVRYNLIDRQIEADLLPYCRATGVTVLAYSPLAKGLQYIAERDPARMLSDVARQTGKSEAQVALNWCVSHPGVVAICKANSLARMEENGRASGWRLTDEQLAMLDRIRFERGSRVEARVRRWASSILDTLGLHRG